MENFEQCSGSCGCVDLKFRQLFRLVQKKNASKIPTAAKRENIRPEQNFEPTLVRLVGFEVQKLQSRSHFLSNQLNKTKCWAVWCQICLDETNDSTCQLNRTLHKSNPTDRIRPCIQLLFEWTQHYRHFKALYALLRSTTLHSLRRSYTALSYLTWNTQHCCLANFAQKIICSFKQSTNGTRKIQNRDFCCQRTFFNLWFDGAFALNELILRKKKWKLLCFCWFPSFNERVSNQSEQRWLESMDCTWCRSLKRTVLGHVTNSNFPSWRKRNRCFFSLFPFGRIFYIHSEDLMLNRDSRDDVQWNVDFFHAMKICSLINELNEEQRKLKKFRREKLTRIVISRVRSVLHRT